MNACDICSKTFKRRDNMLRHKRHLHGGNDAASNDSELSDGETTESETNGGMSDADEASETEVGGDRYDPWDSVVRRAFDKCRDQFEEEVSKLIRSRNASEMEARTRVYLDMRSVYRKAVGNVLTDRLVWFDAMRKHPVYKAIKKTATNFVDLDDYSPEEAWKSAIGQRKYLFDTILAEYNPPEVQGSEEEEEGEEDLGEPTAKRPSTI